MYFPSYVLLTWSVQAAEWAWEVDELADLGVSSPQGIDDSGESTSEPSSGITSQVPGVFEAVAFRAKVVEAVVAADGVLHPRVGDGFDTTVFVVPVVHEDVSRPDLLTGARSVVPIHLPVLSPRPLDLREIEQPEYTAQDNVHAVDLEATSGPGRWVLKGYKTMYAHLFRPDALRQAVVDGPHEVNECDDLGKVHARKSPTVRLSSPHVRDTFPMLDEGVVANVNHRRA
jgi:hypothetical protein